MEFSQYKFTNNPFRISPTNKPEEMIWVGMDSLKQKIDNRIQLSIKTTPSRIVINWGRYGSGKTHAANYYTKTGYIQEKFGVETKGIKVNLPRSSKDPVQSFLRALIGQMDFDNIIQDFKRIGGQFGEDAGKIVDQVSSDSIISLLLKKILGCGGSSISSLFPDLDTIDGSKDALRDYIYGDTSKATLKKLNLPLGLEDDEQIVNLISGLFNVITYEKKIYKAVFLWIDEFEDIESLPKPTQDRFTTFLRQLIDKTPNNLIILLNFTLKGSGEFEDLSIILGEALASRAKVHIDFEEPNDEESLKYIQDLINHPNYRNAEDVSTENPYYPFTESSVKYITKNIGRKSLRKINETFSLILEMALIDDNQPSIIDKDFIDKISLEIPSWKKQ